MAAEAAARGQGMVSVLLMARSFPCSQVPSRALASGVAGRTLVRGQTLCAGGIQRLVMCSRYSLTSPPEAVRATFRVTTPMVFPPRYNIAPTQPVTIVRVGHDGGHELALVRWGLIPSWVKDPGRMSTLINARAETAAEKPAFRGAMRHRRCLVPADTFYEWTGKAGAKRPYLIRPRGGGLMGLAGLWDHWLGADGSEIETMAILTVAANREVGSLHDRMPAIVPPVLFDQWLDARTVMAEAAAEMLVPATDGSLEVFEVSRLLNNWRNDVPEVQEPVRTTLL
jgi:putative SOS response-associated peptidase YedK